MAPVKLGRQIIQQYHRRASPHLLQQCGLRQQQRSDKQLLLPSGEDGHGLMAFNTHPKITPMRADLCGAAQSVTLFTFFQRFME